MGFFVFLALGTAVFLATNLPIAGAVLPAMYGCWRSLGTALWIVQSDPYVGRARICAVFCIAVGFWYAAMAAFGSVILFSVLEDLFGRQPNDDEIWATAFVILGGFAFTTLVGLTVSVVAAFMRLRVWVHPRLRELTHGELGRAGELPAKRYLNYAFPVVFTSLTIPLLCISFVFLFFTAWDPNNPHANVAGLLFVFAGLWLALLCYEWFSKRMIATHPAECWPIAPIEPVAGDRNL